MKVVMSTKDGKSVQKELAEDIREHMHGKKIGDKVTGKDIGFEGYEFEITGGSDSAGFAMRSDVEGHLRKRIFTAKSTGVKLNRLGMKVRKSVAGNTIFEKTAQVNMKVLKEGKSPLAEPPAEEASAEGAEQKPAEGK